MEHLIFKAVKINISIINLRQLTMIKIIMILSKFQAWKINLDTIKKIIPSQLFF